MNTETLDLHLMKINEFVQDEDRIVTCTSLAVDLDIELDKAQAVLSSYVTDQKQLKPDSLAVTYLVSGTLKGGKGKAVYLVQEVDLPRKIELLETVPSEQIFSVQKSKQVDFNVIASVDKLDATSDAVIPGSVVGKNCIKAKVKVKKIVAPPKKPAPPSKNPFFKMQSGNTNKSSASSEKSPTKSEKVEKATPEKAEPAKQKPKPAGGLANFFSKVPPKSNAVPKKEPPCTPPKETKPDKQTDRVEDKKPKVESVPSEDEKMEVDDEEVESPKPAKESSSQTKSSSKKRKKKASSKKDRDDPPKRRKRIQVICDSDSSDMFGGDDRDEETFSDVIEKTDDESSPPVFVKAPLAPKNKIRKTVEKVYMDEEGFMVTKTEYEYEDAPEDEKEPEKPAKVEEKPKPVVEKKVQNGENEVKPSGKGKKNNKKPPTGKQPTLMSFFKKA